MKQFEEENIAFLEWDNSDNDDIEYEFAFMHKPKNDDSDITRALMMGFFGGYHSRDLELLELQEENERLRDIFREIESFNEDGSPLCCPNCVMELQEYLSTITEQALREKK